MADAIQEDSDQAVAEARILARQPPHLLQYWDISDRSHGAVAEHRAGDADQLAGAAPTVTPLSAEGPLFTSLLRLTTFGG
jgi:hypothetical protein